VKDGPPSVLVGVNSAPAGRRLRTDLPAGRKPDDLRGQQFRLRRGKLGVGQDTRIVHLCQLLNLRVDIGSGWGWRGGRR
jgi:hypothetical protein